MKPVTEIAEQEASALSGLLFDLDDTLLDHGVLALETYASLFRMKQAGLELYAVTGRSAAWGQVAARQWPIDGAVAENGAVAFERSAAGFVTLLDWASDEREARVQRLSGLVREIRQRFPDLAPADDVTGRLTDYTFDIGETRRADPERVALVSEFARTQGARVHRSSVHLHVTFDHVDKAQGTLALLGRRRPESVAELEKLYAYVGDSQNDESCFAAFATTVGVANLNGSFRVPPRYQTHGERGTGFVELAGLLLERRRSG
jgi:HAD superfamily hydrolase (TIGR01484 family)